MLRVLEIRHSSGLGEADSPEVRDSILLDALEHPLEREFW